MPKSMFSSGETGLTTNSDTAVTAIAMPANGFFRNIKNAMITNEGGVAGFVSIDNGITWVRLPASTTIYMRSIITGGSIMIKRVSGGSDLSGVFVSIW